MAPNPLRPVPPRPKPLRPSGLAIGDVARRTGLAVSAIRYYEDEGLITPYRAASGQRRFTRADLRILSFIRIAQSLGFPLARIRTALATLPDGRPPSKADWTRLSTGFRADLDARIAQLETLRDTLDGCIGCGCLSLDSCALYNAQDRAATRGSGPRYLMGDSSSDP
ncbi:redox-sensitive transcriptional activator SoxR [Marinibacterium sp. SX1]|uniref:redox-sensitive transcriptional activator SoxR n=1 Tax=Marinibacterium sp. SX1 TaxID=3388424 RepID=UPI003D17F61F